MTKEKKENQKETTTPKKNEKPEKKKIEKKPVADKKKAATVFKKKKKDYSAIYDKNKSYSINEALEILKTKLYQLELEKQAKDISSNRKEQIGKGERAEKIRTYNFPQDRITDHRLNKSFSNISRILNGELEIILQEFEKQQNSV